MTDERDHERARSVIEACPEVSTQPCLITGKTFNALVERIKEYGQQVRREALEEAAKINEAIIEAIIVRHDAGTPGVSVLQVAANMIRERASGRGGRG